jgi:hypothetical protein
MHQVIKHKSGLEIRRLVSIREEDKNELEMRFDKIGPDRIHIARYNHTTGERHFFMSDSVAFGEDFYNRCIGAGWRELERDIKALTCEGKRYEFEELKDGIVQVVYRRENGSIVNVDYMDNSQAEAYKDFLLGEGWEKAEKNEKENSKE